MRIRLTVCLALLSSTVLEAGEKHSMLTLYDSARKPTSVRWRSVNDDVMGGVSRGGFRILHESGNLESGHLEFSGNLSLKNGGGFASMRSTGTPHDLDKFAGIALRIRGDGRRYAFNVHTNQTRYGGSYRGDLPTRKGEWVTVHVPFASLRATFHGRALRDAPPLNRAQVKSVGVTLADKREGPFKLQVDWIKAYPTEPPLPPKELPETGQSAAVNPT